MPLLSLHAVRKTFGERVLIDRLDLELAAGERLAITGESGAGKSTLLNIVAGLEPADSGKVVLDGVDLASLDEAALTVLRRDRIGFVFQAFHVLPHLSLVQNVALPLLLQGCAASERTARAQAMLTSVGLGNRPHAFPRELSGGELQRVAIARALVHRPRLLLADEPTGNLDPDTADAMLALLTRTVAEAGAAMLLVTHSPQAARTCDRILRIQHHGQLSRETA
ncbi:MAG TPA: ABC transporter ATP-binding protein [Burkholderiaceae bacterium]|nr:ABC transporter ATP-binding protein [Burkholderiaceae bacterium]